MIERLKPCHCGSGKRLKNCCGQITETSVEHKISIPERKLPNAAVRGKNHVAATSLSPSQIGSQPISSTTNRKVNMFFSLFQTASGAWHIQSILVALGWFITGVLLFVQLSANRNERFPRYFTKGQKAQLITLLNKSKKYAVEIQCVSSQDEEALKFAEQIKSIFEEAGFSINPIPRLMSFPQVKGIRIKSRIDLSKEINAAIVYLLRSQNLPLAGIIAKPEEAEITVQVGQK